jgi:uncharacterized LabA/DUF88 family protein
MVVHKDQRVGVFIDVQNVFYSAKHLYGAKVNYKAILKEAVAGRKLVRAICYVITTEEGLEKGFHEALENIGFEIRSKDLQIFYGGAKKGDWDVGIAMDIMRMASKLDVVVLVSGDGDFQDLLEHVKALGCKAEVLAFGRAASSRLKETCDEFLDVDVSPRQFLISGHRSTPRPSGTTSTTEKSTATAKTTAKPAKPVAKSASKPATKSATKPAAKPAAKTTAKK